MKLPIPAWAGSVIVHLIGLLLLILLFRSTSDTRGAPGVERTDHVGIVLKSETESGPVYHNERETFEQNQRATESAILSEPLTANQTFQPSQFLPTPLQNVIGPTTVESGGAVGQAEHLVPRTDTGLAGARGGTGSEATVSIFGLAGTGHRFAFVFDRSDSMGEYGSKPIREAKAALIQAIDPLQSVHQLFIVFYNETPSTYPSGERPRMIYATDDNKEAAKAYVRRIVPGGGTNHYDALLVAARLNPDVIFLLTDGEEKDDLSIAQLDRVIRASGKSQINVIQFGFRSEQRGRNYRLKQLAEQNAGLYKYIEIGTL